MMGKWRQLFERSLPPPEKREYGEEYAFGPPATQEEIEAAEQKLGIPLPTDVREMLLEFNGIWDTSWSQKKGSPPEKIVFLDTKCMSEDVPHYFRTCGNNLPPDEDLRRIVFVYQQNGFAELYGVCVTDVQNYRAGEVIRIDHELGELGVGYANLAELISIGPTSAAFWGL